MSFWPFIPSVPCGPSENICIQQEFADTQFVKTKSMGINSKHVPILQISFFSATTWDGECRICGRDCNRFKDFISIHKEIFGILQVKEEALELNIITEKGWCQ